MNIYGHYWWRLHDSLHDTQAYSNTFCIRRGNATVRSTKGIWMVKFETFLRTCATNGRDS